MTLPPEDPAPGAVRFTTKIALVLHPDLPVWQQLNVAAFLATGIVGAVDAMLGSPYEDADGTTYLALCRQPITILEGDSAVLASSLRRALERDLRVAIYTRAMFGTGNDEDNRAAVMAVARQDLDLVGICVYGGRSAVDKAVKGTSLHR